MAGGNVAGREVVRVGGSRSGWSRRRELHDRPPPRLWTKPAPSQSGLSGQIRSIRNARLIYIPNIRPVPAGVKGRATVILADSGAAAGCRRLCTGRDCPRRAPRRSGRCAASPVRRKLPEARRSSPAPSAGIGVPQRTFLRTLCATDPVKELSGRGSASRSGRDPSGRERADRVDGAAAGRGRGRRRSPWSRSCRTNPRLARSCG